MRRTAGWIAALITLALGAAHIDAQPSKTAQQILAAATQRAAAEHKVVFLDLGATWCVNCHRLDAFLASPQIAPIVDKYFVFAGIHYDEKMGKHPELETPGSEALMAQFGGEQGVPFFMFFDVNGDAIVTSARPVKGNRLGENIGYPNAPEEIDWFMAMLQKAVPSMSEDEAKEIRSTLKHSSTSHQASSH
jgi:thiol:disulfide interchange protein